jgi:hypothetical protein
MECMETIGEVMKKIIFLFVFIILGCNQETPEQQRWWRNSFKIPEVGERVPVVFKNKFFLYDSSNGFVKYRFGGGWKDRTIIVTTKNDTVLSVWVAYAKLQMEK